jgi:alpha-tubulin suppressor-like RCC1 family protein
MFRGFGNIYGSCEIKFSLAKPASNLGNNFFNFFSGSLFPKCGTSGTKQHFSLINQRSILFQYQNGAEQNVLIQ